MKSTIVFWKVLLYIFPHFDAGVAELVDARDSKSRSFGVSVRFRPPVPLFLVKLNKAALICAMPNLVLVSSDDCGRMGHFANQ